MEAPQYRDHAMALYSAFAGGLAVALVCVYWIAAAWPEGGRAAALAAVAVSFFGARDDPVPSILGFIAWVVVALVMDAVYLFAILPRVHDFEMLVLALAPAYLLLGVLMALPSAAPVAGPIIFQGAIQLALEGSYSADFADFANGGIASVVGISFAAVTIRLIRSVGAEWAAGRLLRANRRDIAEAAIQHGASSRNAFMLLVLDRLGLVVTRLAASAEKADAVVLSALADLRVGINIVELRRHRAPLPTAARAAVDTMLAGISAQYRQQVGQSANPRLLALIDAAIAAVTSTASAEALPDLMRALVGLRRALFPQGPPYEPKPAEPAPPARQAA